jgi:hypothetical protein
MTLAEYPGTVWEAKYHVSPGLYPYPTARVRFYERKGIGIGREVIHANSPYRIGSDPNYKYNAPGRSLLTQEVVTTRRAQISNTKKLKDCLLAEDVFEWTTESGRRVMFKDLPLSEYVYHDGFDLKCETAGDGTPSAFSYLSGDRQKMVHCFNCKRTTFCMPTHRPARIRFEPEHILKLKENMKYINQDDNMYTHLT